MDVYQYNAAQTVNGFSVNDHMWVTAEMDAATCDALQRCQLDGNGKLVDATGKLVPGSTTQYTAETCLVKEVCVNSDLRKQQYDATASNGRYVDAKNAYVFQLLRSYNLFHGLCLLAFLCYKGGSAPL